jgi:hypothetical protein
MSAEVEGDHVVTIGPALDSESLAAPPFQRVQQSAVAGADVEDPPRRGDPVDASRQGGSGAP